MADVPRTLALLTTLVVGLAACARRTPTYHADVEPIVARHCVGCHSPGGVSPQPRFDTYEQASRNRQKLKSAVQTRRMPPWGADNTGLCGTWEDALWLTSAEIATLVAWADGAGPAGKDNGPRPPPPPAPRLGRVDTVLDMGEAYTPTLGSGSYRCFPVDPKLAADAMLTALRVTSSEPRIVSQVTLFAIDSPEADAAVSRLDAHDPGPGYRCYGSARVDDARLLASWTWDSPVLRFPRGTGLRMRAGRRAVLQIHYDVIAAGLSSSSRTRLELALAPPGTVDEASIVVLRPGPFRLPGGQRYAQVTVDLPIAKPLTLHAVAPRMHTLGKVMQIDHLHGQERRCAANFDHWSFYRQQLFRYARPVHLDAGDTLRATCSYTTLNRGPIEMGEDIEQEECVAYLYATP